MAQPAALWAATLCLWDWHPAAVPRRPGGGAEGVGRGAGPQRVADEGVAPPTAADSLL